MSVIPFSPYQKLAEIQDTIDALLAYGIYYKDQNIKQFAAKLKQQHRELEEQITLKMYQDSLQTKSASRL